MRTIECWDRSVSVAHAPGHSPTSMGWLRFGPTVNIDQSLLAHLAHRGYIPVPHFPREFYAPMTDEIWAILAKLEDPCTES